ncbi:MAG: hypothetical protein AAGM36_17000, partial [Cyanobacteria bacterium J06597_1]
MKINADLTKRAVIQTADLPWIDSPLPGVQRRMLDRDGDEDVIAASRYNARIVWMKNLEIDCPRSYT